MSKIFFNTRDEMTCIDDHLIAYRKASGNYSSVKLITGKELILTQTLSKVMKMLEEPGKVNGRFIRVGRSFIVNQDFIHKINLLKQMLILSDGVGWSFEVKMTKSNLKFLQSEMINRSKKVSISGKSTTPNSQSVLEVKTQLTWGEESFPLHSGQNWIGRTDWEITSDVMVDDEFLSRRSAFIEVNETDDVFTYSFVLQRTTNKVLINDKSVKVGERVNLEIGDKISMGNTLFELKPIESESGK